MTVFDRAGDRVLVLLSSCGLAATQTVINLLRLYEAETAILFCATRDNVRHLHAALVERGFAAVALSGEHSQNERNQISGFANSLGCLAIQAIPPQITSIAPWIVKSFQPGVVTLSGQGFLGTTQVLVNGVPLASVFTTPDDATLRFNPPIGSAIGAMTVQTSNNAGTSNIATLQVVDTTPTAMLVNGAVVGGNNLAWSFGGTRNSLWALVVGSVGTTSPLLGLSVLDNPTVLTYGLLSPFNGLGSYTTFVPANQLSGLRIYSQVVELDLANNLAGISSSNVAATLVVN
jgi:hypothetical protein